MQQAPVGGAVPPAESGVEFCPFGGDTTVRHHLLQELEGEFRGLRGVKYAIEERGPPEFGPNWFTGLVWLIADYELEEVGEGTVRVVHGAFENGHSPPEKRSVVLFRCCGQVYDVFEIAILEDLLNYLCGEMVDRHFETFARSPKGFQSSNGSF